MDLKGLRHTHATILLEQGVSPKVIQERLGHTTITTTMNVYSHVTPTMQRAAVKEFTRTLASGVIGQNEWMESSSSRTTMR